MSSSSTDLVPVLTTFADPRGHTRGHALYRHYDRAGTLLYVGITNDPARRWRDHALHSPWVACRMVAWVEVVWFADTAEAARTERATIRRERPLFNKRRRGGRAEAAHRLRTYLDAGDPEAAAVALGTPRRVRCCYFPGVTCIACGPDREALYA